MATAPAHVAPPPTRHLLLNFMLASSWAWLALLLATIAATLHALRLHFSSVRLPARAQNAAVLAMSPIDQPCEGQTSYAHAPLLQRHFKQRTGSKSTSALAKVVVHSRARLWRRVFSSASFALHRTASESKFFHSHLECAQKHQRRLQHMADVVSVASAEPEGLPFTEQVVDLWKAEAQAARRCLNPESTTVDKYGDSSQSSVDEDEDEHCTAEIGVKFPSWALSMSSSSPFLWSPKPALAFPPSHLAFEKQFGWDKLLDAKIGVPWSFSSASDTSVPSLAACSSVVRVWDDLPRKLMRNICLDERRILSLDTRFQEGLACTGSISGKILMWDLERRAYVSEAAALRHPVLALSMDSDVFATVLLASATGFGLWDHRSPTANLNMTSMPAGIVSGVKSRGNGLCVATGNGSLSIYDLRKPSCGPVGTDRVSQKQGNVSLPKYDRTFWLKFTCTDEDEDADADGAECHFAMEDSASKSPAYASWLSKLTTYVRSVTLTPH